MIANLYGKLQAQLILYARNNIDCLLGYIDKMANDTYDAIPVSHSMQANIQQNSHAIVSISERVDRVLLQISQLPASTDSGQGESCQKIS